MSDWISVEDSLPKIGQIVEIKSTFGIEEAVFTKEEIMWGFFKRVVFGFRKYEDNSEILSIRYWRPIKEKRPDFSKLNKGDFIFINRDSTNQDIVGFFVRNDGELILSSSLNSLKGGYDISNKTDIKKITRINVENKTFEEI